MKWSYYPSVIVLLLLAVLTWLLMSGLNLNSARFDRELKALDDFLRFERGLNREVLTARVGLSRNYDELVRITAKTQDSLRRLRAAAASHPDEISAIDVLERRAGRETELIEHFKTKNALLQNSLAYFGVLTTRLVASNYKPVSNAATKLAGSMLLLTIDTSKSAVDRVQDRLGEFSMLERPPGEDESVSAVLAHGRMLVDVLPDIDGILKALIVETDNRQQDIVRALIVQRQLDARASARRYRLSLYITSLVLLVSLVILGLQLRKRALALRRQAAFEHVIADISMRFINSQHHELAARVESALEQLAEFIGADRAYFVVAKHSSIYQWAREEVGIAKGWPELMMYRALRLDPGRDGIIRTARCRPDASERELLEVAGLQSWLCVRSLGNRADTILGFDGVHARTLGSRDDFALFRMAFDAIINAMDRVIHEQERERLEASLQHADRMETIGTFASGIAHNFNNIVAAILGYTEIADARIRSGKEPSASLGEIRRAGERARELVDRILSFGSRGEGRRQPLSVKALISETQSLLSASLPPDISLSVIDASETMIVSGERAQLQQVILNVCNNAAQAMHGLGTIDIQIEAHDITHSLQVGRKILQPGRFTIISISDPGRGMDKATMERIFEPFFTTRAEGNGLGLATVRDIVEEHNGSIEVRSTLGVGTRFIIWLPSVWSQDLISVQRAGLSGSDFGRAVLVFDMDQEHLLRHEEIVAALGYEPLGFTDLTEAEQACRSRDKDFDAVLVCHQPGGAALSSAAALHAAAPNLPIILAVPSTRNLDSSLLAASGIAGIVRHPLTSSELSGALARCLAPSVARLSA